MGCFFVSSHWTREQVEASRATGCCVVNGCANNKKGRKEKRPPREQRRREGKEATSKVKERQTKNPRVVINNACIHAEQASLSYSVALRSIPQHRNLTICVWDTTV